MLEGIRAAVLGWLPGLPPPACVRGIEFACVALYKSCTSAKFGMFELPCLKCIPRPPAMPFLPSPPLLPRSAPPPPWGCMGSGNLTPAVLRAKGVLQLSEELAATIDGGRELPAGPAERALRATAVAACDAVVAAAEQAYSAAQLGAYLGFLTDEGQELHGKVRPHLTRGPVAY